MWIGKNDSDCENIFCQFKNEKPIPRADAIALVIKFSTTNAPKDERILCLLNKWPIEIEA